MRPSSNSTRAKEKVGVMGADVTVCTSVMPALERLRQGTVSLRLDWATQEDYVSKEKKKEPRGGMLHGKR
jgi:hypothetical protein